jgi:hypothetical protein
MKLTSNSWPEIKIYNLKKTFRNTNICCTSRPPYLSSYNVMLQYYDKTGAGIAVFWSCNETVTYAKVTTCSCSSWSNHRKQNKQSTQPAPASKIVCSECVSCTILSLILTVFQTDSSPYRAEKDGGIWRLVFNTDQDDHEASEEVVTSIQGILCKNGLPPFLDQIG